MNSTAKTKDAPDLDRAILATYTELANCPFCPFDFNTGRPLAERLRYTEQLLSIVPYGALASFSGTGNPFLIDVLNPGDQVLDVGSGAGTDAIIAARIVGAEGRVTGIDVTKAMVERARDNAWQVGASNLEFIQGRAERLPFPDNSVDVIISNGVFNLCPDKVVVFREMHRVLKPGGRLQFADILVESSVPEHIEDLAPLWAGGVAGGLVQDDYLLLLRAAGFDDVRFERGFDIFSETAIEDKAAAYGARGYHIRGFKVNG